MAAWRGRRLSLEWRSSPCAVGASATGVRLCAGPSPAGALEALLAF